MRKHPYNKTSRIHLFKLNDCSTRRRDENDRSDHDDYDTAFTGTRPFDHR